jgi:hypothetical protein
MRLSRRVPLAALIVAALLTLILAASLTGCGAGPPGPPPAGPSPSGPSPPSGQASAAGTRSQSAGSTAPAVSATPRATHVAAPSSRPVAPGAGALPQTRALPRTTSVAFRNAMGDLWLAVTTGNPRFGLPAFFPEAAYKQVKAIPYPAADWQYRLWYDFGLDVRAAHRLAGPEARLVRVIMPAAYTVWVPPGACYNSVGYWHAPGARVVYRVHGQERSFGIASLISWRGVWYVVHFGAVTRGAATGIVDDPAVGPGVPGPPGGC